jgi:hypothetical protein
MEQQTKKVDQQLVVAMRPLGLLNGIEFETRPTGPN